MSETKPQDKNLSPGVTVKDININKHIFYDPKSQAILNEIKEMETLELKSLGF